MQKQANESLNQKDQSRSLVSRVRKPHDVDTHMRMASRIQLLGTPKNLIKVIFYGTLTVVGLMFLLLCQSYISGNTYVLPRITACGVGLLYMAVLAFVIKKEWFSFAAWMIVALYAGLATAILWFWSINAQIGILVLGFVIILAGTIVGARYIIPVTAGAVVILGSIQLAYALGYVDPDRTSLAKASTFADVFSYGIIFIIFALISWLSRSQMEQALRRALAAESALELEKSLLATRLDEQTRNLRAVQLEEMQQLYRFAELGQLSTVVLHELANHLTVLTLDIDDIQQRTNRSEAIIHAKESISYLDAMVDQVRKQLQESAEPTKFNVFDVLKDTAESLKTKATKSRVRVSITKTGDKNDFNIMGDPLRLSQVVTIIVTNAIDSYNAVDQRSDESDIDIAITAHSSKIILSITDYGVGISEFHRSQLFEPFKSTKEKGMGIGLFIAKKMIETHFKGMIWIDPRRDATEFVIQLTAHKTNKSQR